MLWVFAHGAAKVIDGVHIAHILFEHKNLLLGILSLFLLFYLRILLFSNLGATTEGIKTMYKIIRSNRKTVAIQISGNGEVIVRAPLRMPRAEIMKFVDSKADWIARHQEAIRNRPQITGDVFSEEQICALYQ